MLMTSGRPTVRAATTRHLLQSPTQWQDVKHEGCSCAADLVAKLLHSTYDAINAAARYCTSSVAHRVSCGSVACSGRDPNVP